MSQRRQDSDNQSAATSETRADSAHGVAREVQFRADEAGNEVTGLLVTPPGARFLLVLAHGAGAGMRHRFMESISRELATRGIGTFRYQFPYMERGSRYPDHPSVLTESVRFAAEAARDEFADGVLLAGGKSLGGRMTSQAAAEGYLDQVEGLVFFGFPLHPPGKPATSRADHLKNVRVPMLFLQGTRDSFAQIGLLLPVVAELGDRATLRTIEGADHSFHVAKGTGRTDTEVVSELAGLVEKWVTDLRF